MVIEREGVWEEIGYNRKSDPDIIERMRGHLRTGIEVSVLDPGVVKSVARVAFLKGPYEVFSSSEMRIRLSRMRLLGWNFDKPYSNIRNMRVEELRKFYREEQRKIGVVTREICPGAMDEIIAENESRVKGDHHY